MAAPVGDQFFGERLEQLHDIDLAAAERRHVVGHAAIGHPIEPDGVEPGPAEILLQAEPRRRNLADGGDPRRHQIGKREIGARRAADQQKRIARHRLAEAGEIAVGSLCIKLVDPHRPAPAHINGPVEQPVRRCTRR